jgi:hypothetical protein
MQKPLLPLYLLTILYQRRVHRVQFKHAEKVFFTKEGADWLAEPVPE